MTEQGKPGGPGPGHDLDELERQFHANEHAPGPAAPQGEPSLDEPSDDERDRLLRDSALGRRLAKRRGHALRGREPKTRRMLSSWGVAGVLAIALWSAAGAWPSFAWWLSAQPPIDLGHLGSYDYSQARDGLYARAEGVASPKRGTYSRLGGEHELFPLVASRILVDRAGPPDDAARGLAFHYSCAGRLSRAEPGGKWEAVREKFYAQGELAKEGDVWVLEDGVEPRKGLAVPLEFALWALLALACAAVLLRRLRARTSAAA
jgi:hypothetical protein